MSEWIEENRSWIAVGLIVLVAVVAIVGLTGIVHQPTLCGIHGYSVVVC